jgi:hypothetical protein
MMNVHDRSIRNYRHAALQKALEILLDEFPYHELDQLSYVKKYQKGPKRSVRFSLDLNTSVDIISRNDYTEDEKMATWWNSKDHCTRGTQLLHAQR